MKIAAVLAAVSLSVGCTSVETQRRAEIVVNWSTEDQLEAGLRIVIGDK